MAARAASWGGAPTNDGSNNDENDDHDNDDAGKAKRKASKSFKTVKKRSEIDPKWFQQARDRKIDYMVYRQFTNHYYVYDGSYSLHKAAIDRYAKAALTKRNTTIKRTKYFRNETIKQKVLNKIFCSFDVSLQNVLLVPNTLFV